MAKKKILDEKNKKKIEPKNELVINPSVKKKREETSLKKISENADQSKFVEIGKLVQEGKVKYICYSAEGNVGYFNYQLIV